LEDELAETRLRAAIACCRLFIRDITGYERHIYSLDIVNEVLEKLLMVSIADTGEAATLALKGR